MQNFNGFTKLKNGNMVSNRSIYYPNLSVGKLKRLLSKVKITNEDIEVLKDYKYLLLFEKQIGFDKGFFQMLENLKDGFVMIDNFWILNINSVIKRNDGDPYHLTNNNLVMNK